jgi:class 3 adenylate cyclase
MVFFNDPIPLDKPAQRAVEMALAMRDRVRTLAEGWSRLGHDLGFGVGIAQGFATLGRIGYEGRFDYAAIGSVTNLAARLCAEAGAGQVLVSQRVFNAVDDVAVGEPVGALELRGFSRPISAVGVSRMINSTLEVPS